MSHDQCDWEGLAIAQTNPGIKTGNFYGRGKRTTLLENEFVSDKQCILAMRIEELKILDWVIEADHYVLCHCSLNVRR